MRVRVRFDSEVEEKLWGLAAHAEDALFLLALGVLGGGVLLLMSFSR